MCIDFSTMLFIVLVAPQMSPVYLDMRKMKWRVLFSDIIHFQTYMSFMYVFLFKVDMI